VSESLRKSADEVQYSLRSSFFYRRRDKFKSWLRDVRKFCKSHYDWDDLETLGISDAAWDRVAAGRLRPPAVFCHPAVISSRPDLVGYYRCIAALPQKGTHRLAFGTGPLEDGKTKSLSDERAMQLARLQILLDRSYRRRFLEHITWLLRV
jgi:hypothetical protein